MARFFATIPVLYLAACSGDAQPPSTPNGGAGSGGMAKTSGGTSSSGGTNTSGGATTSSGGANTSGGASAFGGSGTSGGASAFGGSGTSGGSGNNGGSGTSGGSGNSGGSKATGGGGAGGSSGGSSTSGGSKATGGSSNSGGSGTSGGSGNSGGSKTTGGAAGTAGTGGGTAGTGGSTSGCGNTAPGTAVAPTSGVIGYGAGTTGGAGKATVTVSSLSALEAALKSDVTIKVNGTISGSGMVSIKEMQNISIIGEGSNGKFQGIGLSFVNTQNIIIQNLSFTNSSDDSINIEDTTRAWVDHNTMSTDVNYLDCDMGSVKDKYDGQIDIKKNSKNITVSYNYIHDACKAMLLGFSDGKEPDDLVTYHHNRFEKIGSRLPLIRSAHTHVYNNYYKNILTTGINVRMDAQALIENNYFDTVDDPILSADSDKIGYWNVSGNIYVPNGPTYTHKPEGADVVGTVVGCEVKSTGTFKVPYTYKLDKANDVPPTVTQYAGAGKL